MSDFLFYMKKLGIKPEECDRCGKLKTLKPVRINDVVYYYCLDCERETFEEKKKKNDFFTCTTQKKRSIFW